MKPILALIAVVALAACGASNQGAASEVGEPVGANQIAGEPADVRAEPAQAVAPTVEIVRVDAEATSTTEMGTTTTTAEPAANPPSTTTTSTTVPDVDIDLSDLDALMAELDGLMGDLGTAMNQTEGEFTP